MSDFFCSACGDDVPRDRAYVCTHLLRKPILCTDCGDLRATRDRASWCVVQPYGKGPYMLVTEASAPQTLRDTNQKATRS